MCPLQIDIGTGHRRFSDVYVKRLQLIEAKLIVEFRNLKFELLKGCLNLI